MMLNIFKIVIILLFIHENLGAIISHKSPNSFQIFLNSIRTPNINFKELYDKDSLYDADMILNTFSSLHQQNFDYDYEEQDNEFCKWSDNTQCSDIYEPVCVTDLNCIYVLKNKCKLDKINCKCTSHYVLPSSFCENFSQPLFKRCNIKIFIQ